VYVAENSTPEALQELVKVFEPHPPQSPVEEKKKPNEKANQDSNKKGKQGKQVKEQGPKEVVVPLSEEEKRKAQEGFKKAIDLIKEAEAEAKRKLDELRVQEKISKRKALEEDRNKEQWTLEEMSVLAKAVAKFPPGVPRRWEKITEMVNQVGDRAMKDVITKCKEFDLEQQRLGKDESFKRYQEVMTIRLAAKEESKVRQLGEEIPKVAKPKVVPKAVTPGEATAEVGEEAEEEKKTKGKKGKKEKEKAPEKISITPKRPFQLKIDDTASKGPKEAKKQPNATSTKSPTPSSAKSPPPMDDWTTEQQVAFEKALREVPKSDDRWDKIAELVSGKTKKDCVARFKEIRAKILASSKK